MSRKKFIPAKVLFDEWRKDPEYVAAYHALEEEFALANALIGARAHAGLTQEELAERMGTSQSAIARLESGRGRPATTPPAHLPPAPGTEPTVSVEPVYKAA